MFVKLAVLSCSLAIASAVYNGPLAGGLPAAQYPAGISPQACPNFPHCDNPAVAVSGSQAVPYNAAPIHQQYNAVPQYQPQYNPAPQYQPQPQYQQPAARQQYSPEIQNALDRGEYIGDGDYHGEGLAESGAQTYAGHAAQAYNPVQYQQQAQYQQPAYNQYTGNNQQPQYHQAPAPAYNHAQPAQLPAGVDARACPNYPFCS